jgi:tetratricopeptide (TPR) repeat protein
MHEHSAARQLDDAIHQEIKAHCAQGDAFVDSGEFEDALAAYNKAWVLVPDPKNEWEASTWILAAIGDLSFQAAWPNSGRKALEYAMTCPGGLGNPFLHLRLGQIKFDAGDLDGAADELMRAYMGGAEQIFEQDDPKYLAFLRTRAKI